ncbi:hypothetical protein [Sphingomonas sp. Leaf10]|uniref:hypothetical protein n=1 Tax=Sphingomonas sp. Leaf10 TaxID=1735676 RepID=UPI000B10D591|nr:hypothetical protein [Sphingomonas sp. Leaf10]
MNVHVVSYREVLDQAYGLVLTANSIEKRAVDAVLGKTAAAEVQRRCQGSKLGFVEPHILLHLTGVPAEPTKMLSADWCGICSLRQCRAPLSWGLWAPGGATPRK